MKNKVINNISPDEALIILKKLANQNKDIKDKIIRLAESLMTDIDSEGIADEVYDALDTINVHDLWDTAGPDSYGDYYGPDEVAYDMIKDTLEPFNKELFRLCDLKKSKEAADYCMGILSGLYQYQQDSTSEFKDWATDMPGELFRSIQSEFTKRCSAKRQIKKVQDFITTECPKWA